MENIHLEDSVQMIYIIFQFGSILCIACVLGYLLDGAATDTFL